MIRRITKNTFYLSVSQIVARLIGFFYFIFLARALGVEAFGIYNFTLAFIYNFIPVADFGLERLVLRDIPRKPAKTSFYFCRLIPLRLLLAMIGYLAALVLAMMLGQPTQQVFRLAIFGLLLIPHSLTYLITSFQNAREKMEFMAGANITIPLITALFGFTFVWWKLPLSFIFLASVLANAIVSLLFFLKASAWHLRLGWVFDQNFWRYALCQSWPFAFLTILAVFYLRLSLVLVGFLEGSYLTGLYASAFKFVEAMNLLPQSLAFALFPLTSKLFAREKKRLARIYLRGLGALFLLSLPLSLILILGSKSIVVFAYGQEYLAASPALAWLGLSLVLFFVNALPANIILNSVKVRRFLPLALLNFLIALVLAFVLIPRYSILGAAWAVIGGELAGLLINNLFVYNILIQEKK